MGKKVKTSGWIGIWVSAERGVIRALPYFWKYCDCYDTSLSNSDTHSRTLSISHLIYEFGCEGTGNGIALEW